MEFVLIIVIFSVVSTGFCSTTLQPEKSLTEIILVYHMWSATGLDVCSGKETSCMLNIHMLGYTFIFISHKLNHTILLQYETRTNCVTLTTVSAL
jgi:hypothetical protein